MSDYRIYVACLASYNNGILHGRWIDATQGVDYINTLVAIMLAESPMKEEAEEWAIHDYELGGVKLKSEWESFDHIAMIGEILSLDYPEDVIAYVIDNYEPDSIEKAEELLSEIYVGEYEDLADYAEQYCDDCYDMRNLPKEFAYYIDYERMARDWELSGDIHTIDNGYKSLYVMRAY